jgi:hypothetical protein
MYRKHPASALGQCLGFHHVWMTAAARTSVLIAKFVSASRKVGTNFAI